MPWHCLQQYLFRGKKERTEIATYACYMMNFEDLQIWKLSILKLEWLPRAWETELALDTLYQMPYHCQRETGKAVEGLAGEAPRVPVAEWLNGGVICT